MSDDQDQPPADSTAPEPVTTYRWADRAQTKIIATCNGVDSPFPTALRAWIGDIGPYQHTVEDGLAAARAIVAATMPAPIRMSMTSYAIKIMAMQDQAEMAEHFPKFSALDQWEGDMLEAGKMNKEFPDPPEWLAEYSKDF